MHRHTGTARNWRQAVRQGRTPWRELLCEDLHRLARWLGWGAASGTADAAARQAPRHSVPEHHHGNLYRTPANGTPVPGQRH